MLAQSLLLLIALVATAEALAQGAPPPRRDPRANEAADTVRRVEIETGGDVLRAEPMQRSGREVYRLKVLTPEGRVRVMQDDPREHRERSRRERMERQDAPPAREPARDLPPETDRRSNDGERPTP